MGRAGFPVSPHGRAPGISVSSSCSLRPNDAEARALSDNAFEGTGIGDMA